MICHEQIAGLFPHSSMTSKLPSNVVLGYICFYLFYLFIYLFYLFYLFFFAGQSEIWSLDSKCPASIRDEYKAGGLDSGFWGNTKILAGTALFHFGELCILHAWVPQVVHVKFDV